MNQGGARREGCSAESEKAIDVGYTDENAGERPILEEGGMDRLGVVLFLDVTGIGIVRRGDEGIPYYLFFAEGGCGVF